MRIQFHKYQGTGNDFVMIDDRAQTFPENNKTLIAFLCDRRLGVGADGVILIQNHPHLDFRMVYFNPDGSRSLCGNGSRCAVAFARSLGVIGDQTTFETTDGVHEAFCEGDQIHFQLHNVAKIERFGDDFFINTGSPHHVEVVENLEQTNVFEKGKTIRYLSHYQPHGTNVNFLEKKTNGIAVRTYERGVENETLSCGTGVTACALVASQLGYTSPVPIQTQGGKLTVSFASTPEGHFENIYLAGPAEKVFEGDIYVSI